MRARVGTAFVFVTPSGHACTVCDSAAGAAMRAGIFNEAFLGTFLEVLAPFAVLGLVLWGVNRFLPD